MMSCGDCRANLDEVPVGTPCPKCGGERRDAVVTPDPIGLVLTGQPVTLNIHRALHTMTSDTPTLREVTAPSVTELSIYRPEAEDGMWLGEVRTDGEFVAFDAARQLDDVLLNLAVEISNRLRAV